MTQIPRNDRTNAVDVIEEEDVSLGIAARSAGFCLI